MDDSKVATPTKSHTNETFNNKIYTFCFSSMLYFGAREKQNVHKYGNIGLSVIVSHSPQGEKEKKKRFFVSFEQIDKVSMFRFGHVVLGKKEPEPVSHRARIKIRLLLCEVFQNRTNTNCSCTQFNDNELATRVRARVLYRVSLFRLFFVHCCFE